MIPSPRSWVQFWGNWIESMQINAFTRQKHSDQLSMLGQKEGRQKVQEGELSDLFG